MTRFEPHGDAALDMQGRVLSFRPQGPGNAEEMQRLLDAIAQRVVALQGATWAALVIGRTDHLLTPEAERLLASAAPRLVDSGQRALAIVVGDGAGLIMRSLFAHVYAGTRCMVEVFHDEDAARTWLERVLGGVE